MAAGFAERYVIAYLQAGSDGERLAPFLGYTPELPGTAEAGAVTAPVRTVDVAEAGDGYWAVTVAVGFPGGESFWRAGVDVDPETFAAVAVGLPAVVAAPARRRARAARRHDGRTAGRRSAGRDRDRLPLRLPVRRGRPVARYLRPGTALTAVEPAVCGQVEIVRWGVDRRRRGHARPSSSTLSWTDGRPRRPDGHLQRRS